MKSRKGEVQMGKKFADADDWFKGLSVVLENTSGKTITYLGAGFLFPKLGGVSVPPLYKAVRYGIHPEAPSAVASRLEPLALQPGGKIIVTLSDYEQVVADLNQLEYTQSIKSIKFNLEEVYFDDGTSWIAGKYFDRKSTAAIRRATNFVEPKRTGC